MFKGKAGVHPSEALFKCPTLLKTPALALPIIIRLEKFARDKHSSSLETFVN
jgi:hypothetical protein